MSAIATKSDIDAFVAFLCARDVFLDELGPGWSRSYGRLDPTAKVFATLAYEHPDHDPVRIDVEFDAESSDGWRRRALRCADDPALPGLRRARLRVEAPTVIRYRPGKRCVIRGLDRESGRGPREIFAKTFADARGDGLWRDAGLLFAASADARLGFSVAKPAWFDPVARTIAHYAAPGAPIGAKLSEPGGPALVRSIAAALATIPASGIAAPERLGAAEQWDRTRKYLKRLARDVPPLATLSARVGDSFERAHASAKPGAVRPIHGAPHPQQWLEDEGRLALVDFDRFSLGPPELDAATFVAELDFEPIDDAPRNNLIASFVDAYEAGVGAFDRQAFALYRLHKHAAKAVKAAGSIRTDRIVRARRILESVAEQIEREVL